MITKKIYILFIFLSIQFANDLSDDQINKIKDATSDLDKAPNFTLSSVTDSVFVLEELIGNVVLINFWATWCGPCRMEIPDFNDLYLKHKDDGLIILGISTDDSKRGLIKFLETYKIHYPILYGSVKQISKISNDYGGIISLPVSVVIDRAGEIKRIYPSAILKDYTPSLYASFIYDVKTALETNIDSKVKENNQKN